jgi:Heterokaryon incompatibility protein (HET)
MANASRYVYSALPPHYIRVLLLHGAPKRSDPLFCEITALPVDKLAERYIAVSYTWDNQSPSVPTKCGDRFLLATRNCYEALQAMREADSSLLVWIDGLCINQADLIEKSVQVSMMKAIFENAGAVYLWLGEWSPALRKLVQDMKQVIPANSQLNGKPFDPGAANAQIELQRNFEAVFPSGLCSYALYSECLSSP